MLQCKPMQKQFASFNTFVSRRTLPYSSCDGLCTDQNDTAAMFIFAMTLPSFALNFPKPGISLPASHRKLVLSNAAERSDSSNAKAQRTQVRSLSSQQLHPHLQRQYFRIAALHHLRFVSYFRAQNTQQHIKSALHAVVFSS